MRIITDSAADFEPFEYDFYLATGDMTEIRTSFEKVANKAE